MSFSKILRLPLAGAAPHLPPLPVAASLAAVYVIWGSHYLATAIALQSYPPFMLTAMRLLAAILILLTSLKLRGVAMPRGREAACAILMGAVMFAGAGAITLGQDLGVASGLASLAVGAVPVWAVLISLAFGYRPCAVEGAGLIVGIGGLAILNLEGGMQSQPMGAGLVLAGSLMWAFGSVMSNRLSLPRGIAGVMFQMTGGFLALALISLARGERFPADPTPLSSLALCYLAVVSTLLAFSAYMYLVRHVRPALATSYAYVNPVIAVILGAALLAEPVTGSSILATIVIVTGVVLVMLGKGR